MRILKLKTLVVMEKQSKDGRTLVIHYKNCFSRISVAILRAPEKKINNNWFGVEISGALREPQNLDWNPYTDLLQYPCGPRSAVAFRWQQFPRSPKWWTPFDPFWKMTNRFSLFSIVSCSSLLPLMESPPQFLWLNIFEAEMIWRMALSK